MDILVFAVATAFNFLILKWKLEHKRYADFTFDLATMAIISFIFAGTMSGMAVGMMASFLISLYLLFFPPTFLQSKKQKLKT